MTTPTAARIAFAGNARYGVGGQGEFLRQTAVALEREPAARVYARDPGPAAHGVSIAAARTTGVMTSALQRLPVLRARPDWVTLLDDLDFDRRVARQLESVDLFDGVMGQSTLAAAAARRAGAAVIMTSLNTHIDALAAVLDRERVRSGGLAPSFVHPAMQRRVHRAIAEADWIRVLSQVAARSFAERGVPADRIRVIQAAVNLDHFRPCPPRREGALRVLAVGSIEPRKGSHVLLEAFTTARLDHAELELVGGTGSRWSRRLVERYMRAHANVTLRHVDVMRTPAADTYGRASVLVHAALEDGFGLVVAQALAAGRPVIVSDATGASELVADGVNGFVVPAGSARAIADRLELLASDADLLERMSAAAPQAVAHLGYPDHARALTAFYREVLA